MERVEQRLQIAPLAAPADRGSTGESLHDGERGQLLDLAEQLAEPELSVEVRLSLVASLRRVLDRQPSARTTPPQMKTEDGHGHRRSLLPPSLGYTEYSSNLRLCQSACFPYHSRFCRLCRQNQTHALVRQYPLATGPYPILRLTRHFQRSDRPPLCTSVQAKDQGCR
jgi:hypothetical protein